jgi:hypothetical protein
MRDVIKQLNVGTIIATSGVYIERTDGGEYSESPPRLNQEILNSPNPPQCDVCAKGAIFLSSVRNLNKYDDEAPMCSGIEYHLVGTLGLFTTRAIDEIESVFELYRIHADTPFGRLTDDHRLRWICNYIIDHDGEVNGLEEAAFEYED